MHICTCWIVRIRHGCNVIDAVLSGNILWYRTVIVYFRSSRIVRGGLGRNASDVVRSGLLPAVYWTDFMHRSGCWILCSGVGRDLIDALRCRIIQFEHGAGVMYSGFAGIVCR